MHEEEEDDRRYVANQIHCRELIFHYIWSLLYAMKWLYFTLVKCSSHAKAEVNAGTMLC